jgi:hypothetical protein
MLNASKVGVEKPFEAENNATTEEDIGMEKSIEIKKFVAVEGVAVKPEPTNETSIVVSLRSN